MQSRGQGSDLEEGMPDPSGAMDMPGGTVGRSQRPRARGHNRSATGGFTSTGPGARAMRDAVAVGDEDPEAAALAQAARSRTRRESRPSPFGLPENEPFAVFDPRTKQKIRSVQDMPYDDSHFVQDQGFAFLNTINPRRRFNLGPPDMGTAQEGVTLVTPEAVMEALKPDAGQLFGVESEEQWQETTAGTMQVVGSVLPRLCELLNIRDSEADDSRLEQMVEDARLSEGNGMRQHAQETVRMLQANPSWKFGQKERFVQKLIKASAQL